MATILTLVIVLLLLIHKGNFNALILSRGTQIANQQLEGKLSVEKLEGSLFSNFALKGILIKTQQDTLFYCEGIWIEYDPQKLLNKTIHLNHLHFENIYGKLYQNKDSLWNFEQLVQTDKKSNADTSKIASPWKLVLKDFQINSLLVNIEQAMKDSLLPSQIRANLQANGRYTPEHSHIQIDSLKMKSRNPNITMHKLTGRADYRLRDLSEFVFSIRVNRSQLQSSGTINLKNDSSIRANINLTPLHFSDLKTIIPDFPLTGHPDIQLEMEGNIEHFSYKFALTENKQQLSSNGWISEIKKNPNYQIQLQTNHINAGYWMADSSLLSNIHGKVQLEGKGFSPMDSYLTINGRFDTLQFGQQALASLDFSSTKEKDRIKGNLNAKNSSGAISASYRLKHIFKNLIYELDVETQNLNLAGIPGAKMPSSRINTLVSVTGKGTHKDSLNVSLVLSSQKSSLLGRKIEAMEVHVNYNRGNYKLDSLLMQTAFFDLETTGEGNIFSKHHLDYELTAKNTSLLLKNLNMPVAQLEGKINGSVSGNIDSLQNSIEYDLYNIHYDSLLIATLQGSVEGYIADSIKKLQFSTKAEAIQLNKQQFQSLAIEGNFENQHLETMVTAIINDSLRADLQSELNSFEQPVLHLHALDLYYKDLLWSIPSEGSKISLLEEQVEIENFELKSDTQKIKISGQLALQGNEKLDVHLQNIRLEELPTQYFTNYRLRGRLSSITKIRGTAASPLLENQFTIDSLKINDYLFSKVQGAADYKDQNFTMESTLKSDLDKTIRANARIPIHFSLADSSYLLNDSPNFNALLQIDSLEVKRLKPFLKDFRGDIGGFFSAEVRMGNSIKQPHLQGSTKLTKGRITYEPWGIFYKNIHMSGSFNKDQLNLEQININDRKGGALQANGNIKLKSAVSPLPEQFLISITAKEFEALNAPQAQLVFNSQLKGTGSYKAPKLNGSIKIVRSRFNADYFSAHLSRKTDDPNPPLLVQAMTDTLNKKDTTQNQEVPFSGNQFYKRLQSEVSLNIPGNTWIKGENMNFEISGSVKSIKETENMHLFGSVNVERGTYRLYGKNFRFERGTLQFTGGQEINPKVDFVVNYRFRDAQQTMKEMRIHITGRVNTPELAFFIDNRPVEEKNAIAYLAFGKNVNELTMGQQSQLNYNENLAINLAVNQLSRLLSSNLQQTGTLDVMEVNTEGNWRNTSVTLGKYITNKLYLSYEQNFSFEDESNFLESEKLMLEYQFLRNFLLKATNQSSKSGFDLIFRKSWK